MSPFRPRPISMRQRIDAAPHEVWAVVAAPGYLEECHPFCRANPVDVWPGPGSQDTVEYYNGRQVTRRFTTWREGEGYDLEARDATGPGATVSWRISPQGSSSLLTIELTPRMLGSLPSPLRWVPYLAVVRPLMRRYLESVGRGVAWRVTTGEPVRRNQFGTHPWFSPKPRPPQAR